MKVLLYGLNYAPEMTGIGKYSGQLGAWLFKREHKIKSIASPPYYPEWVISTGYKNFFTKEIIDGVEVRRCPLYVPRKPSVFRRLLHLWSFVLTSAFALITLLRWRPNVVINVVPAMFTSLPALLYCKVTGAKLIIHIQDFESDAMMSLDISKSSLLSRLWLKIEKYILTRADKVSTISKAMIENAVEKGVEQSKVIYFPNWSEIDRFKNVVGVDGFKQSLGFGLNQKIVLYSGNIGRKQGLELVIETAALAKSGGLEWVFLICGDGAAKEDLVAMASQMKLTNVVFKPLQSYEDLPKLLAMADAHLIVQKPSLANAVLPSKLTNILAVGGNAVITTSKETEMGRLVDEFPGIAISVEPQNAGELLTGIKAACGKKRINSVALSYASQFLSKDIILKNFEQELISLISA